MSFKKYIPPFMQNLSIVSPYLAAKVALHLFLSPERFQRTEEEQLFWEQGGLITFSSGCRGRFFSKKLNRTSSIDDMLNSNQPVVWFVHGWESRSSRFQKSILKCVEAGYLVIAWDGPAHGDNEGKKTNIVEFARFLKKDAQALIQKNNQFQIKALIGHSFGAGATAYSCLLGFPTEKLILISGPSSVLYVFERFWKTIRLSAKAQKAFVQQIQKSADVSVVDISLNKFLNQLSQKILVIHDKQDKEIPFAEALEVLQNCPTAKLVATENLGHRRILFSDELADLILEFVQNE